MNGVGAPPSNNPQPLARRSFILAVQHYPPPDELRHTIFLMADVRKHFSIHFLTLMKVPSFNQCAGCCVCIRRVFLGKSRARKEESRYVGAIDPRGAPIARQFLSLRNCPCHEFHNLFLESSAAFAGASPSRRSTPSFCTRGFMPSVTYVSLGYANQGGGVADREK